jgi:hypothetical protein
MHVHFKTMNDTVKSIYDTVNTKNDTVNDMQTPKHDTVFSLI